MTTKIKWRLSKLPSVEEVADLVKGGILSKDEAREILFSQESEEERDKESLKDEIKFLRELVKSLGQNRSQIASTIYLYQTPYSGTTWFQPYMTYCNSATSASNSILDYQQGSLTSTGSNSMYLANVASGSTQASLTYNGGDDLMSFTDIKTF